MSHIKRCLGRGEKGTKQTLEDSMHLVVPTRFRRLAGHPCRLHLPLRVPMSLLLPLRRLPRALVQLLEVRARRRRLRRRRLRRLRLRQGLQLVLPVGFLPSLPHLRSHPRGGTGRAPMRSDRLPRGKLEKRARPHRLP